MGGFEIRPVEPADKDWIRRFEEEHWSAPVVVAHGVIYRPHELPGFIALSEGKGVGLITYTIDGSSCEIVTLNSLVENVGIGTALVEAVLARARQGKCSRLWLITTNDNLHALGFYQKRGFELVAVHRNALKRSRELNPRIPLVAPNGIPIRDEIELEFPLEAKRNARR